MSIFDLVFVGKVFHSLFAVDLSVSLTSMVAVESLVKRAESQPSVAILRVPGSMSADTMELRMLRKHEEKS